LPEQGPVYDYFSRELGRPKPPKTKNNHCPDVSENETIPGSELLHLTDIGDLGDNSERSFFRLTTPTPWPNLNARLLAVGAGLPVAPLDRLAQFSPSDFERFVLEWATDYLARSAQDVYEVQQRGGSGDKGRDIVVWLDPPTVERRRWRLFQCKRYADRLGMDSAAVEIGKVLYYTSINIYTPPVEYCFVTHKGISGPLQDLLDDPNKLRVFILTNWDKYCSDRITANHSIPLTHELRAHISKFDFGIFRAKQPHDLIDEYSKTRHYLKVFGAPLVNRLPPPLPPSTVAAVENRYIASCFP
jgi:hypothetical protein